MILSEQIAALQTQLATAQQQAQQNFADLTAARGQVETLTGQVTALTTERDEARTQLGTVTGERDQARTALQTERDSRETAISAEVTSRIAAAGGDPIRRDPAAATSQEKPGASSGLTGMARARAYFADRQPTTPTTN